MLFSEARGHAGATCKLVPPLMACTPVYPECTTESRVGASCSIRRSVHLPSHCTERVSPAQ